MSTLPTTHVYEEPQDLMAQEIIRTLTKQA